MKRWRLLSLAALVLGVSVVSAGECGNGLPCGSIPWPQPNPPQLQSPTPMPTIGITLNPPTQTPGGSTATPAPTEASFDVDVSGINDQFATLQYLAGATQPAVEVSGTPVNNDDHLATLTSDSATFFGYVRGVSEINLGNLTPVIGFALLSFVVVIGTKLVTLLLPVLAVLFGFLRKVISVVLDFLPF